MSEPTPTTGIGAPVRAAKTSRFITGNGRYTDDINVPGQTYAVFLRSPYARAAHYLHRCGRERALPFRV